MKPFDSNEFIQFSRSRIERIVNMKAFLVCAVVACIFIVIHTASVPEEAKSSEEKPTGRASKEIIFLLGFDYKD